MSKVNVQQVSVFTWDDKKSRAATLLAQGNLQQAVADECGVNEKTIRRWLADMAFAAEVDRLSLMVGIASRAERLRIAMRVIKQKIDDKTGVETEKDILEWLKFAQGETDGIKLDLTKIAAAVGGTEDNA